MENASMHNEERPGIANRDAAFKLEVPTLSKGCFRKQTLSGSSLFLHLKKLFNQNCTDQTSKLEEVRSQKP